MARTSIINSRLLLVLLGGLSLACIGSGDAEEGRSPRRLEIADAYALAGEFQLPDVPPGEFPELHNVYHLSDSIISGSEPRGAKAFERLQSLGVKTILSVDGKVPDRELAAAHGMRYVHSPIRYSGIEDEEMLRLTKTFRELEGPFYVHCFHGRHRGPAAAAIGRLVVDGAPRERVIAEMRQWCGTSEKYAGLYGDIANKPLPDAAETTAYAWEFPSAHPMEGIRQSMVALPRLFDSLDALADRDWQVDPGHPDVDPLHQARTLLGTFRQTLQLPEVDQHPADFRQHLEESIRLNEQLVSALQELNQGAQSSARGNAMEALDAIAQTCSQCHKSYRNSRD